MLVNRTPRRAIALLSLSRPIAVLVAVLVIAVAPRSAVAAPGEISVTPLYAGKADERGGDLISGDFSPPENSLLVMITVGIDDDYDVRQMEPVHNLPGRFSEQLQLSMTASSRIAAKVWTLPVGVSSLAGAGFTYPGGQSVKGRILMLFAVTGHDPSAPIGLHVTNAAIGDTDGAMTLPGAPDARSLVIAGRLLDVDANQGGAAIPAPGWTALGDESVYERAGLAVQYRVGVTSPAISWADVNAAKATNQQCGGFAIEIRAAALPPSDSVAGKEAK